MKYLILMLCLTSNAYSDVKIYQRDRFGHVIQNAPVYIVRDNRLLQGDRFGHINPKAPVIKLK
jgi:hypothetical protein